MKIPDFLIFLILFYKRKIQFDLDIYTLVVKEPKNKVPIFVKLHRPIL